MFTSIRPEIKTVLFFIAYFIMAFIAEIVSPSGVCTPGFGFLLFILSIPVSIIYSLVLYFKYNKSENKQYLNCIYIISGIWVILFLILNFNN
jgi:multisubunit Na+/H+ antiporter MnhB subunit